MMKNLIELESPTLKTDEQFIENVIIPMHYHQAEHGDIRFGIKDNNEQIIICSNDFARIIGYKNFREAINKKAGRDYEPYLNSPGGAGLDVQLNVQRNYFMRKKKAYIYMYHCCKSGQLYLVIAEPVFDMAGQIIGKKETEVPIKMLSHKEIVEQHFHRYDIDVISLENISSMDDFSEREELILFMLIGGFTQEEIAGFLKISRAYVYKIIAEKLCPKFNVTINSTKLLIEKAIALGFAQFIPNSFLEIANK